MTQSDDSHKGNKLRYLLIRTVQFRAGG